MPSVETSCPHCGAEQTVEFEPADHDFTNTLIVVVDCPACENEYEIEVEIQEEVGR